MSTTSPNTRKGGIRWTVPAIALAAGIGYLIAGIVGGISPRPPSQAPR